MRNDGDKKERFSEFVDFDMEINDGGVGGGGGHTFGLSLLKSVVRLGVFYFMRRQSSSALVFIWEFFFLYNFFF